MPPTTIRALGTCQQGNNNAVDLPHITTSHTFFFVAPQALLVAAEITSISCDHCVCWFSCNNTLHGKVYGYRYFGTEI